MVTGKVTFFYAATLLYSLIIASNFSRIKNTSQTPFFNFKDTRFKVFQIFRPYRLLLFINVFILEKKKIGRAYN